MEKSLRKNQLVIEDVKEDFLYHEHFLTPEQLEEVFKTNLKDGLSEEQAEENLEYYGPNALVALKGDSYWKILRHNLCGWFQCVLWIGAILNFTAYISAEFFDHKPQSGSSEEYIYLGIVISLTVLLTGLFGFYVEAKNVVVMSEFEKMVPASATVIRDGVKMSIPNNLVTIGDIAEMKAGEMVPADICIIECTNFATDTSSLTGESKPVYHSAKFTDPNRLETKNMCFFSCPIIEGTGRGVVVAVGEMTEIGKIACLVTGLEKEETPIAKEIARFIKILLYIGIIFGITFFIMVYMVTNNWVAACQYMLGIILANVPEGLLVTLTVCLTLSARHLKTVNCLAKSLQAVETLGSTSCICSDKTGTLTKNVMSVSHIFCDWNILDKDDHTRTSDKTYTDLCTAACLNLRATFAHDSLDLPIKNRKVLGDASETAILKYMETNRSATVVQAENPKVAEIPFSSATKYQISIHEIKETKSHLLVMKGGPEIVLEYCSNIETSEGLMPITPEISKELKGSLAKIAQMGERVIGYAHLTLAIDQFPFGYKFDTHELNFPLSDLSFLGAISLVDPPRTNIDKYIQLCRNAGIRVVMVTGDHPITALAISRKCGLITATTAIDYAFEHHIEVSDIPKQIKKKITAAVITGDDLRKMSSHELIRVLTQYVELSFARTSPQQKLLIVETYQKLGHVVAVTGDGVNDSPALKKADIGIAMGITGTEVSKQAADMILLDDNFASIVKGVEEGRRIFDNLKKTIAYTLTSNTPEMLPFVLYALIGMPLPLTLMLILVINVGTDLLPAMSLAYEASEEDIMKHLPRKSTDHLVTCVMIFMTYFQMGLLQFFAGMYVYFFVFAESGFFPSSLIFVRATWEEETAVVKDTFGNMWDYNSRKLIERKAQTAYFVAICWTQISDAIVCKTRRVSLLTKKMNNHPLNASILIDLVAASAVTYMPIFNELFQTQPLEWYVFFLSVPYALLMIFLDEIRRFIIRNNLSEWVTKETYY